MQAVFVVDDRSVVKVLSWSNYSAGVIFDDFDPVSTIALFKNDPDRPSTNEFGPVNVSEMMATFVP